MSKAEKAGLGAVRFKFLDSAGVTRVGSLPVSFAMNFANSHQFVTPSLVAWITPPNRNSAKCSIIGTKSVMKVGFACRSFGTSTGPSFLKLSSIQLTILRSSGAHEEGGVRDYDILTKSFSGSDGQVEKLHAVRVSWDKDEDGRVNMQEIPGSEFDVDVDLVLLAMGFLHPQHEGMLSQLGVNLDGRGNVQIDDNRMTNVPGVFAGGDMARGQSLVVWAIAEGRETARCVDEYLMGETKLPRSLTG